MPAPSAVAATGEGIAGQDAGALPVLCGKRQWTKSVSIPHHGGRVVVQVVKPAQSASELQLVRVQAIAGFHATATPLVDRAKALSSDLVV